jgi:hypothetical protein
MACISADILTAYLKNISIDFMFTEMASKVICASGIDVHKGEYPHQQNLLDKLTKFNN